MEDNREFFGNLKDILWNFIREFPITIIGILFIVISLAKFEFHWSPNLPYQILLYLSGAVLVIIGVIKSLRNYNAWQLGIKKAKLRQISMQPIYDKLHKKSAYKAKELKYTGTGLRGLFSPIDRAEPRYNFQDIIVKNKNLSSMMVLLLNPNPPMYEQQQLSEVEAMQAKYEPSRRLREDIPKTLNALGKIYSELPDNLKEQLSVKVANEIFYVQFNMADDEMIATHYCCGGRADESPVYYLRRTKDGLFERYLEDFKMMWNDAFPVQFEKNGNWQILNH